MKILFIGGTGNISAACARRARALGHAVTLLTRGRRNLAEHGLEGTRTLPADIGDEAAAAAALGGETFDVVCDFIAYQPAHVERDIRLFEGRCGQYIFVSSAGVYQKPPASPYITESTPLRNPFWDYARAKIACEDAALAAYRERGFPITIARPSLTYETVIPVAIGSWDDFTIVDRMRKNRPVVVHGDGTSLWTVTHSEDFAKGFVALFGHPGALGQAFHITSDELLTWNQIYESVAAAADVEARIVHIASDFIVEFAKGRGWGWMEGSLHGDKAVSAIFDNAKIKALAPDFRATIPFREGIRRTIAWFEAKPERMRINEANNEFLDGLLAAYGRATGCGPA